MLALRPQLPLRQHQHAHHRGGGAEKAKPKKKAINCDLCAELGEPSCVYACPHEAALRVDPQVFFGEGVS